jgi:hypothetical protein
MLLAAAPVACAGALAEADAGVDGRRVAPVERGTVELTPGTMGVTSVGTGATGVTLGAGTTTDGATGRGVNSMFNVKT